MSFLLYNVAFVLLSPLIALWIYVRLFVQRRAREGWRERMGEAPQRPSAEPCIWVHAVSAGEMVAAAPVVRALRQARPDVEVVVSTMTPAGLVQARRLIADARATFYFPIDFWPCVCRALARVRPSLFVAVETEVWPNFLHAAARRGIPTAVVNGRFSDRTLRRLTGPARLLRLPYAAALRQVKRLAMQTPEDVERAVSLGAPRERVTVCGNTKFDQSIVAPHEGEQDALCRAFGLRPDQPLWIAGSTHPGEEEQVLAAWHEVRATLPDLALMIAPRHIERADQVEALCRRVAPGHPFVRRSRAEGDSPRRAQSTERRAQSPNDSALALRSALCTLRSAALDAEWEYPRLPPILLLDTLGELAGMYALASVVFVGGSLAPVGGHDVLQPLFHGKPTFFGPHMHNQRDLAALSLAAGATRQVSDAGELAAGVRDVLTGGRGSRAGEGLGASMERGARVLLDAHRGAAERSALAVIELLGPGA